MSTHPKEEGDDKDGAQKNVAKNSDGAEKKKVVVTAKSKKRQQKRRRRRDKSSSAEAARDEMDMCRTVQQKYGTKKKVQDDIKEALFDPTSGKIFHPSSYERMMKRSVEAHQNRMLQPEPPNDLVDSNWLCAFCLRPSFADEQGDLYGPYFVRLSPECQPPAELICCQTISSNNFAQKRGNNSSSSSGSSSPRRSAMTKIHHGTMDIWLHGNCALWAPELFLVGGRLPTLQLHVQRYWKQKCLICSGVGATIPITYNTHQSFPHVSSAIQLNYAVAKTASDLNAEAKCHFLHYKCALENGYRLNSLTYMCCPPSS